MSENYKTNLYHKEKDRIYVKIDGALEDRIDINMLLANDIKYINKLNIIHKDADMYLLYDLKNKQPFNNVIEKAAPIKNNSNNNSYNEYFIEILLKNLFELRKKMSDYMLNEDKLLLDLEYIYLNPRSNIFEFIYVPDLETTFSVSFKYLVEAFLDILSFDNKRISNLINDIYNNLCDGIIPEYDYLDKRDKNDYKDDIQDDYNYNKNTHDNNKRVNEPKSLYITGKNDKDSLEIPINKESFTIGRGFYCDYILPYKEISNFQITIKRQNDEYHIARINSENDIYLNDIKLLSDRANNKAYMIKSGDILKISDFKCVLVLK